MNNINTLEQRITGMNTEIENRKQELERLQKQRNLLLRQVGRQRLAKIQERKTCLHS